MFLYRLAPILRWLVHRNRAEQDLNDDVQAFVDLATADKVRNGVLPTEAVAWPFLISAGFLIKPRVRESSWAIHLARAAFLTSALRRAS